VFNFLLQPDKLAVLTFVHRDSFSRAFQKYTNYDLQDLQKGYMVQKKMFFTHIKGISYVTMNVGICDIISVDLPGRSSRRLIQYL